MASSRETLAATSSGKIYEVVSKPAETRTKKIHTDVFSAATDLAERAGQYDALSRVAFLLAVFDLTAEVGFLAIDHSLSGVIVAGIGTLASISTGFYLEAKRNGISKHIDKLKSPENLPKMSDSPRKGGMNN